MLIYAHSMLLQLDWMSDLVCQSLLLTGFLYFLIFAGPYDLNKQLELNRKLNALLNQAAHGAFRHAPPESKSALGTREKQQWESLGNISRVEAMRQFAVKAQEIKAEAELLERTHGGQ